MRPISQVGFGIFAEWCPKRLDDTAEEEMRREIGALKHDPSTV
jgi:hypothetical protein